MTNKQTMGQLLDFERFALQVVVDIPSSIEQTLAFNAAEPNFVFAVGFVELQVTWGNYLLVPELQVGNLVQTLTDMADDFAKPKHPVNIEGLIEKGGWCQWMRGYWARVDSDSVLPDDESRYAHLIPLSVLAGREGHIACYEYDGINIVEAATRSKGDIEPVSIWAQFDSNAAAKLIRQARDRIVDNVHRALSDRD